MRCAGMCTHVRTLRPLARMRTLWHTTLGHAVAKMQGMPKDDYMCLQQTPSRSDVPARRCVDAQAKTVGPSGHSDE
eukprot:2105920-Alexandrium_andersonii.AAC.1